MFYKLSKLFFILFLFYEGWFSKVILNISMLGPILGVGIIVFFLLHKIVTKNFTITIPKALFLLFVYIFFALVSGVFVAYDESILLSNLLVYMYYLILMLYIVNVSVHEKDNKFFIYVWLIYSIVYMITMLFWGYETSDRLILTKESNANGDALVLVVGVFSALILINTNKLYQLLISLFIVGMSMYTIVLTGSRKSFLTVFLMVSLWLLFVFKEYWKSFNIQKKILSFTLFGVSLFIVMVKLLPPFFESPVFLRLTEEGVSISDDATRSDMYNVAFTFFYENPILGIGYGQFPVRSIYEGYSHSTYAEVLSTTGLIGTLIYFSAYAIILVNLISLILKKKTTISFIKSVQYFILMVVMLVLGMGVVHSYSLRDSVVLAIIISFYYIEKVKKNKQI